MNMPDFMSIELNSNPTKEKINRPMNSFMLYKRDKKHEILALYPGINFREISKIVADQWKMEDVGVKKRYSQMAAEESRMHKERYPDYKYPSSISKRKKKNPVVRNQILALDLESEINQIQLCPQEGLKSRVLSSKSALQRLLPLDITQLVPNNSTSIPNSPKDLVGGPNAVTNNLLSPISYCFERDPILNSFFNSWEYSQLPSNGSTGTSNKNLQYIQSSLAAHLSGHGFTASL